MQSFLENTIESLKQKYGSLSQLTIILPSKRAGGFLTNFLKKTAAETSFAPRIISIEEFIEEVSGVGIIPSTELLFTSYKSYLSTEHIKEKESFESFCGWANTLLGDFNEIDRYLLDTEPFFNYLKAIQDTEHWYLKTDKTPLIERYLSFWENLPAFYKNLAEDLLSKNKGYQGLVYRKAAEDIEIYKNAHPNKQHVFIGFNALNKAEQTIFQELLETNMADIFWDVEAHFMSNTSHSSSLFLRKYKEQWKYYQDNPFKTIATNFLEPKVFTYVATQKNISQAKYVGTLLQSYTEKQLNNTAIVLADEQLLLPILYALPHNVTKVNITMGVPLEKMPLTSFFELLLKIKIKNETAIYYKDILQIVRHPFFQKIDTQSKEFTQAIVKQNKAYYTKEEIFVLSKTQHQKLYELVFNDWGNNSEITVNTLNDLLETAIHQPIIHPIDISILVAIQEVINEIKTLNKTYPYSSTTQSIATLFKEIIATKTLDFKGDAYEGLQIMGVLESRVLDFENVIITSVNEGILPAGKSTPSFITYDLKKQYNLPGYLEKDAIYSYHFTHLLHRAKSATFIYNTHAEGLNNGEMSRFLMQLEIEKVNTHTIEKKIVSPTIKLQPKELKEIQKTSEVVKKLKALAANGFSPSALAVYVRNPIDFYYKYILGIKELTTVEETIAANTLGTIVHETLEVLYTPFLGTFLDENKLSKLLLKISDEIKKQFSIHFKGGDYSRGKNLLIFEVAKTYVEKFISFEISQLQQGNTIELLQLEEKLKAPLTVEGVAFPVYIKGMVDRVDRYNGTLRIIDYKTGKVTSGDIEIVDWNDIVEEEKYSKALQVLSYATMYGYKNPFDGATSGIYSFKNLQSGFLPFATKTSTRSSKKNTIVTPETISLFKNHLATLVLEMCNIDKPFIEKETLSYDYF